MRGGKEQVRRDVRAGGGGGNRREQEKEKKGKKGRKKRRIIVYRSKNEPNVLQLYKGLTGVVPNTPSPRPINPLFLIFITRAVLESKGKSGTKLLDVRQHDRIDVALLDI